MPTVNKLSMQILRGSSGTLVKYTMHKVIECINYQWDPCVCQPLVHTLINCITHTENKKMTLDMAIIVYELTLLNIGKLLACISLKYNMHGI